MAGRVDQSPTLIPLDRQGHSASAADMACTLLIGDRTYSSWSLRAWLLFDVFGIPVDLVHVDFSDAKGVAAQLQAYTPARTVPTLVTDDGAVVWDSLAIAEEVASRYPEAPIWPADSAARGAARTLAAEMHSGFSALRNACPMNLRLAYDGFEATEAIMVDLARIEALWAHARSRFGQEGPWLFGTYSAADAFFAPIAARITTYGLPVTPAGQAYVSAHLVDPSFRRWRAMATVRGAVLPWYAMTLPTRPWPGPQQIAAKSLDGGVAENDVCPYSGKPVTHFAEIGGRVFGFCNAFCRDKTVADPEAWPAFMAIYDS